ncbi:MAG: hypothetical protein FWC41_08670 [Firmicutes bacterium]|nr:hypothetical protein [Bacillota bacterium]
MFNVQNGTRTEFYNSLDTAMQYAVAGDTIYLPAGLIQLENDLVIDKKLALVGVGWDINALQTSFLTEINRRITFTENANGSLLTGCRINNQIILGDNSAVQNIKLIRNNLRSTSFISIDIYSGSSNIFIRENNISGSFRIDMSTLTANLPHTIFIENNIIFSPTIYISNIKNSFILNNVFNSSYTTSIGIGNCIVQNNYIRNLANLGANNVFNNNAFTDNLTFPNGTNVGANNLVNQDFNDTFESGTYQIKETSPCKNAGADGTDIGIYGGTIPYKDGSIPFNPNIRANSISSQADNEGKLRIDITVTAQDR